MPEDMTTLPQRLVVLAIARSYLGAHYVWGGRGGVGGAGLKMLPNVLDPPEQRTLFAAVLGSRVCPGRHRHPAVERLREGDPHNPVHTANPNAFKWPRVVTIKYVNHFLGESCRGKAHFDCIGYVNACLRQTLANLSPRNLSIKEVRAACDTVCKDGVETSDLCAADILIRHNNGHIGFAVGQGSAMALQAEWEATGVVETKLGKWDWHGRLPQKVWLAG